MTATVMARQPDAYSYGPPLPRRRQRRFHSQTRLFRTMSIAINRCWMWWFLPLRGSGTTPTRTHKRRRITVDRWN
jgi:hypothetical protein